MTAGQVGLADAMSTFLTKATILAIHRRQIELYGGASGLRDEGLLEAAV